MSESGSIVCDWIPSKGRLGIFAKGGFENGNEIERCYARLVPSWQAGRGFIWFHGAFFDGSACAAMVGMKTNERVDQDSELDDRCGENGGVVVPFGWGMLYADSARSKSLPNVSWSIESLSSEDDIAEETDPSFGRPCWLVLQAASCNSSGISAGEELVVDRGYAVRDIAFDSVDILSRALRKLDGCDLSRISPEESTFVPKDECPNSLLHPLDGDVQLQHSSRHGLGVFASRPFKKGEVVEVAPVVVIRDEEAPSYASGRGICHSLSNYTFNANLGSERLVCVTLGFGAVYNHGSCPNIEQHWAYAESPSAHASSVEHGYALSFAFAFVAKRDISKGEELLHDYGSMYWAARGLFPND